MMSEDERRIREKLFLRSFALCQEIPRVHQRQGAVEVQCFAEVNKIASAYVMGAPDNHGDQRTAGQDLPFAVSTSNNESGLRVISLEYPPLVRFSGFIMAASAATYKVLTFARWNSPSDNVANWSLL
jgi:hypothetical protein